MGRLTIAKQEIFDLNQIVLLSKRRIAKLEDSLHRQGQVVAAQKDSVELATQNVSKLNNRVLANQMTRVNCLNQKVIDHQMLTWVDEYQQKLVSAKLESVSRLSEEQDKLDDELGKLKEISKDLMRQTDRCSEISRSKRRAQCFIGSLQAETEVDEFNELTAGRVAR